MRWLSVLGSLLVACGDDGGKAIDAKPGEASTSMGVAQVNPCPGTVDATVVTTGGFNYMPAATTITQGQVVKFTMNAAHDVAPLPGTDPNLVVPFGGERCFRFTMPGQFRFKCTPHSFTGMITVN